MFSWLHPVRVITIGALTGICMVTGMSASSAASVPAIQLNLTKPTTVTEAATLVTQRRIRRNKVRRYYYNDNYYRNQPGIDLRLPGFNLYFGGDGRRLRNRNRYYNNDYYYDDYNYSRRRGGDFYLNY